MQIGLNRSRSFICCHENSVGEENTPPFTTEPLTRNVELIKTNNRFDHGVSYSKLSEVKPTFAIHKLAEVESTISLLAKTHPTQQLPLFMRILTACKKYPVDLVLVI